MRLLILISFLFTSCVSLAAPKLPEMTDMASLDFIAEAVLYDGIATLPDQKEYIFNFKIPENTVIFAIHNCHGEVMQLTTNKQTAIAFRYQPLGVEREGDCPLVATAITDKGEKLWSLTEFAFQNQIQGAPKETLKGWVYCNRKVATATGVFLCQSREKLIQRIAFESEVVFAKAGTVEGKVCGTDPVRINLTTFNVTLMAGQCNYLFVSKDGKAFRLNTNAYKGVIP